MDQYHAVGVETVYITLETFMEKYGDGPAAWAYLRSCERLWIQNQRYVVIKQTVYARITTVAGGV